MPPAAGRWFLIWLILFVQHVVLLIFCGCISACMIKGLLPKAGLVVLYICVSIPCESSRVYVIYVLDRTLYAYGPPDLLLFDTAWWVIEVICHCLGSLT